MGLPSLSDIGNRIVDTPGDWWQGTAEWFGGFKEPWQSTDAPTMTDEERAWNAEFFALVEQYNEATGKTVQVSDWVKLKELRESGQTPAQALEGMTLAGGFTGNTGSNGVDVPEGIDPFDFFEDEIWNGEGQLSFDRATGRADIQDGANVFSHFYNPETGQWTLVAKNGEALFGTEDDAGGGSGGGSADAAASRAQRAKEFAHNMEMDFLTLGENIRQFDESLGEEIRQHIVDTETTRRRDLGNLAVQMGQLSLQQQEQIQEILRNPSDFLARAFASRGEESPFGFTSQADLINALKDEFQLISDFSDEQANSIATALAPVLPTPGVASPDGGGAPAPTVPSLSNAGAGGGGTTPTNIPAFSGSDAFFNPLNPSGTAQGDAQAQAEFDAMLQATDNNPGPPINFGLDRGMATPLPGGGHVILGQTPDTIAGAPDPFGDIPMLAAGSPGFIRLSQFVAGDSERGIGNTGELILNPTNAPIGIMNNDATKQILPADVPRFAQGTLDTYDPLGLQELFAAGQRTYLPGDSTVPEPALTPGAGMQIDPNNPPTAQHVPGGMPPSGVNLGPTTTPPAAQAPAPAPSIPSLATGASSPTGDYVFVPAEDQSARYLPQGTAVIPKIAPGGYGYTLEDMQRARDVATLIHSGQATNTQQALDQLSQGTVPIVGVRERIPPLSQQAGGSNSGTNQQATAGNSGTQQPGTVNQGTSTTEDAVSPLQQSAASRLAEQLGLTSDKRWTQQEIYDMAVYAQPPAVRDLLAGAQVHPFQLSSAVTGQQLPMFTPMQLNQLTDDELLALRTRLAAENISLEDVVNQMNLIFGGNRAQRTGSRRR